MRNSDTPRTDAELAKVGRFHAPWPNIEVDFARQLEREISSTLIQLECANTTIDKLQCLLTCSQNDITTIGNALGLTPEAATPESIIAAITALKNRNQFGMFSI
jgi:hypothetical protein